MSLALSSSDVTRLEAALATLLSPLAHETADDWGAAVLRDVRALLAADQGYFHLPPGTLACEGAMAGEAIAPYFAYYQERDTVLAPQLRQHNLEIYHRDLLYTADERRNDELLNDWCAPYRLFDPTGMSFIVDGASLPALVHVYHERETIEGFGERGIMLLSLLLPAFKSGAQTWLRLGAQREALSRLLDALAEGVAVFDLAGRLVYQNPALTKLQAAEPERARLWASIVGAMHALVPLALNRRSKVDPSAVPLPSTELSGVSSGECRTAGARYRVRASVAPAGLLVPPPALLVLVERVAPAPLTPEQLRARYGLTSREIEVAALLGAGETDGAIAAALAISHHTARRHTERVLQKIGVHSRAAVAARLGGGG
ncbi:MAG TPA: helix-turn-helix transcriptional regulator [Gemmatimonadaceae bacterium]|nr:helix-turn-helix transcriptional regulator [Gemmatimonadaceae bacterium]